MACVADIWQRTSSKRSETVGPWRATEKGKIKDLSKGHATTGRNGAAAAHALKCFEFWMSP